jgi:two-component system OmpR family response regulator
MTKSPHLLVVDDHREIRDLVSRFMARHGFRVTTACDGREMRKALADNSIDLIVLDLMLPGEDGLALCRDLRARSNIPVVMLTAMGEETDRIVGLEMGADDYLAKPFNPRELLARIKAVIRRMQTLPGEERPSNRGAAQFENWRLDMRKRHLESHDGVIVSLSTGEFNLLAAFVQHPQRVLSRDQLLDFTHGRSAEPFNRSIDAQVGRLRRKIERDPKNPTLIKTEWGGGYVFTPEVTYA